MKLKFLSKFRNLMLCNISGSCI